MSSSNSNFSRQWLNALHSYISKNSVGCRVVQNRGASRSTIMNARNAANVLDVAKQFVHQNESDLDSETIERKSKQAVRSLIHRGSIQVMESGGQINWQSTCYLIVRRPKNRGAN